ncbi:MAG: phosphomannomutase/phosphoglucomutase [Candidatus Babeliaceae bacterium]
MLDHIFRRYDIRGQMDSELFLEEIPRFGRAFAAYIHEKKPHAQKILVGRDGRVHSPLIQDLLLSALQESGFDIELAGICPTPVMYFGMHQGCADAGIMITASHNGPSYNGFKLCLGKEIVWGDEIQKIHALYKSYARVDAFQAGNIQQSLVKDAYVDWLVEHFAHLHNMETSALLDCGNGVAGTVLIPLAKELNWRNVHFLYEQVDGTYPHHEADPSVFENMHDLSQMVQARGYDLGIGFDGDADRMIPLSTSGELIAGDLVLVLLSQPVLIKNPGARILFDMKCSHVVRDFIEQQGGNAIMVPTGHAIIKYELHKQHALLAGELSGHFYFNDRYFGYDDGIYAALRLFELLLISGIPLHELRNKLPRTFITPEMRIACEEKDKTFIMDRAHLYFSTVPDVSIRLVEGLHITLPEGSAIIRPSHTQAVICVRCESLSAAGLEKVKTQVYNALDGYFDARLYTHLYKTPNIG